MNPLSTDNQFILTTEVSQTKFRTKTRPAIVNLLISKRRLLRARLIDHSILPLCRPFVHQAFIMHHMPCFFHDLAHCGICSLNVSPPSCLHSMHYQLPISRSKSSQSIREITCEERAGIQRTSTSLSKLSRFIPIPRSPCASTACATFLCARVRRCISVLVEAEFVV
jgi:hypothetical protein